MLGKAFDGHGPLGPWLVTPDEIGDPHALSISCIVNGEVRQRGSTSEMINNCWEQIAYLSTVCTLEPGDVIATGTPNGTAGSMKPPRFLQPGDIVRCEIERIGAIQGKVVQEVLV
jgi:2-keto-4-pentenoate hydratase/2-oxohepta-3-ene-1,7-dioic acid hydratase in catechol pathway